MAAKKQAEPKVKPPLRLEWVEAGTLTENPLNWRRHSAEQGQTVQDLIDDPEIGWAGAALFNERTGRLIDGHLRRNRIVARNPQELMPVLIGSWSEDAEKKILATLDPVASMAAGDAAAYEALTSSLEADSLWTRDLIHQVSASLSGGQDDPDDGEEEERPALPGMELQPFEHYDYVMLLFRNSQDFQQACELLGVQKVEIKYPGGKNKVGIGRCLDGARAIRRLSSNPGDAGSIPAEGKTRSGAAAIVPRRLIGRTPDFFAMQLIIPSKGRASVIRSKALRLFPDAIVCVGEDEAELYGRVTDRLLVHPAGVVGIGPLRQWILDNVADPCVVMIDDDVTHAYSQVGFHKRRIEDPAECQAIIERTAILAQDAGVRVFGFEQAARPINYANFEPCILDSWVGDGGIVGVIGRELRFDTGLLLRADIDFCLQSLLRDRIILVERRYTFVHTRFAGAGGNAAQRSSDRHAREIAYLLRKWGGSLDHVKAKGTTRLVVRVNRQW